MPRYLPLSLARLAIRTHVTTDPKCARFNPPRPGSHLDLYSRGVSCPACPSSTHRGGGAMGAWPRVAEMPPVAGTDPALANDIAGIVADVFGGWAPLNVRYGIADAILRAGYTKETS